ncbi:hypothetical protein BC835DRAFT_255000 [Cytidiella melzeri]|nr:hypothetical protein BC835DRAFT_255000 [Cytidiella melzeri]
MLFKVGLKHQLSRNKKNNIRKWNGDSDVRGVLVSSRLDPQSRSGALSNGATDADTIDVDEATCHYVLVEVVGAASEDYFDLVVLAKERKEEGGVRQRVSTAQETKRNLLGFGDVGACEVGGDDVGVLEWRVSGGGGDLVGEGRVDELLDGQVVNRSVERSHCARVGEGVKAVAVVVLKGRVA